MTKIEPIRLDSGAIVYIETTQTEPQTEPERRQRQSKDLSGLAYLEPPIAVGNTVANDRDNSQAIETTIRDYTNSILGAFRQVAAANIDKVKLEFGIEIGGEAGIPYITKGTATSNLKVTVECSLPIATTE